MIYIPFTFKVDGRPTSGIFQTVIAAEGIAPAAARTFAGMGDARSGVPRLTGNHPLNPFEDRLLLYSKIPRLPDSEKFSDVWHMTAFVAVDEKHVRILGSTRNEMQLDIGLRITQTAGAVFFTSPKDVSFIFADETNFDFRMGQRVTPNGKHEESYRYCLLADALQDRAESIVLTEIDVSKIAGVTFDADVDALSEARRCSEFEERVMGAEIGYALSKFNGNSAKISGLGTKKIAWKQVVNGLSVLLPEMEVLGKQIKNIGTAIKKCFEKSASSSDGRSSFAFTRASDCLLDGKNRELLYAYCELLCSHPIQDWNWSDNDARSSFAHIVFEQCISQVLIKRGEEQWLETFKNEISLVARRFDEPYTFLLEDGMLKSEFVIALWRVLNSEGRYDRIKEVMTLYPDKERSHLTLALYGAMCGYAGFSIKRLLGGQETDERVLEAAWIDQEVCPRGKKITRNKGKSARESAKSRPRKSKDSKTIVQGKTSPIEKQGTLDL